MSTNVVRYLTAAHDGLCVSLEPHVLTCGITSYYCERERKKRALMNPRKFLSENLSKIVLFQKREQTHAVVCRAELVTSRPITRPEGHVAHASACTELDKRVRIGLQSLGNCRRRPWLPFPLVCGFPMLPVGPLSLFLPATASERVTARVTNYDCFYLFTPLSRELKPCGEIALRVASHRRATSRAQSIL